MHELQDELWGECQWPGNKHTILLNEHLLYTRYRDGCSWVTIPTNPHHNPQEGITISVFTVWLVEQRVVNNLITITEIINVWWDTGFLILEMSFHPGSLWFEEEAGEREWERWRKEGSKRFREKRGRQDGKDRCSWWRLEQTLALCLFPEKRTYQHQGQLSTWSWMDHLL